MKQSVGRQSFNLGLVIASMLFGIALTTGFEWTPASYADPRAGVEQESSMRIGPVGLGGDGFADLAEQVAPAVVSIQATRFDNASPRQNPLEFFFGPRQRRPQPQEPEERRSDSTGSGFLISSDGLIVTNHHVIEDAEEVRVTIGERQYDAQIRGDDPATDIALLQVDSDEQFPFLPLADSDRVRVGSWVMVIGSPLQLTNSVSVGVVSAKGRAINITQDPGLESFIQTDAAINFGNSGGPLVNTAGAVIGIATAINFGAENIGFAVPVNTLKGILPQLRDTGSVSRGYLGITIEDVTFEVAQAFGLDSTQGALVREVLPESPSEDAGLEHGDIILEVEGSPVQNNRELIDSVASKAPGTVVELTVFRNESQFKTKVELGERPGTRGAAPRRTPEESSSIEWLGIEYQSLTADARRSHGISQDLEGVWITDIAQSSPLFEQNVRRGDIIIEVNGESVGSSTELEEAIDAFDSGSYLRLYLTRINPQTGDTTSFFAIIRVP